MADILFHVGMKLVKTMTLGLDLQTLSDLIISNESRIMDSKNVRYYNKMRVFHFTACIRYQVGPINLLQYC